MFSKQFALILTFYHCFLEVGKYLDVRLLFWGGTEEFNLKDDLTCLSYYVQFVHVNPTRSHSGVLKGQRETSRYLTKL